MVIRVEALVERSSQAFRDLSDEEIEALVQSLNSLHEGELGVDMLVACGRKAITPLQRFLLQGKRSGIFLPRQRAVRALAELGAKDVLLDYLTSEEHIVDPVAGTGRKQSKTRLHEPWVLGAPRTFSKLCGTFCSANIWWERSKRCVSSGVRRLCRS